MGLLRLLSRLKLPSRRRSRHRLEASLLSLQSRSLTRDAVRRMERRANGHPQRADVAKGVDTISASADERRQLCMLPIVSLWSRRDGRSSGRGRRCWRVGGLERGLERGIGLRHGRLRGGRGRGRGKAGERVIAAERGLLRDEGLRGELLLLLGLLHLLHVGLLL